MVRLSGAPFKTRIYTTMEPVTLIIAGIAIVLTASLAYAVNKYQEIQKKKYRD